MLYCTCTALSGVTLTGPYIYLYCYFALNCTYVMFCNSLLYSLLYQSKRLLDFEIFLFVNNCFTLFLVPDASTADYKNVSRWGCEVTVSSITPITNFDKTKHLPLILFS